MPARSQEAGADDTIATWCPRGSREAGHL